MSLFNFTFQKIKEQYRTALSYGYSFITCQTYFDQLNEGVDFDKTIVNRVDIDFSLKKTEDLLNIYQELNIKASFFLRLHAPEYNPFDFDNYRIVKRIINEGHELGYHSEIIDQAAIWNESPDVCLKRDLTVIEAMFDTKITGIASHGGMTGLNNLDFWKTHSPDEFGVAYEAYENSDSFKLFNSSFYISDSEWTRWKCYSNGTLVSGDNQSFGEHIASESHKLVYLLIHPDSYYHSHFYE